MEKTNYKLKLVRVEESSACKKLGSGKWLELDEVEYIDPNAKVVRKWEVCRRITPSTTKGDKREIDATDIHGIIRAPNSPPLTVLVVQYRPAIGRYCIEFPSGIIDAQETVEAAALRELREETGYTGTVKNVSDPICYEPGLTDSMTKIVDVEIDPNSADNIAPEQLLDEDEWSLQVIKVPLERLYEELRELQHRHNESLYIDSRLYAYAYGLHVARNIL
ncbi:14632_t:CDS:2 [Acaulospora morrowiae]|uniref:14632_t:CDS:1 n=1 Tax=Acaulospora morrowiae TaxID=94023 RepID=A0A9N9EZ58_9GLOM|nr:14632_t:CDS:2 [Acaulospora morrowiae]